MQIQGADQLCCDHAANLRLGFCIMQNGALYTAFWHRAMTVALPKLHMLCLALMILLEIFLLLMLENT